MTLPRIEILQGRTAAELLLLCAPTVYQWMWDKRDLFTRIHFGDTMPEQLADPVAYGVARRCRFANDKLYIVCAYHFFHRWDWSRNNWPVIGWLIRWADSHPFDFEGVTVYWEERPATRARDLVVTQAHDDLVFHALGRGEHAEAHISSCSHAVYPTAKMVEGGGADRRIYRPGEYRIINMAEPETLGFLRETAGPIMRKYGSVKMPWEVTDWRIRRKFGARGERAWWEDPEGLVWMAGTCGLLQPEHKIYL